MERGARRVEPPPGGKWLPGAVGDSRAEVWRGWALPHEAPTEASPEGKLRIASTGKGRGLHGHL